MQVKLFQGSRVDEVEREANQWLQRDSPTVLSQETTMCAIGEVQDVLTPFIVLTIWYIPRAT
jgi:hypothetical protein